MSLGFARVRRVAARLMLVAMASFALHGAAMAGFHAHGAGLAQCHRAPNGVHQHSSAHLHHHGDGVVHLHAEVVGVDVAGLGGGADRHTGADQQPCCGTACAVTLAAADVPAVASLRVVTVVVLPTSQIGPSADPNRLKRPPRTPSIA